MGGYAAVFPEVDLGYVRGFGERKGDGTNIASTNSYVGDSEDYFVRVCDFWVGTFFDFCGAWSVEVACWIFECGVHFEKNSGCGLV